MEYLTKIWNARWTWEADKWDALCGLPWYGQVIVVGIGVLAVYLKWTSRRV